MSHPPPPGYPRAAIDDCWNRIGVRGDSSCPELKRHVHCRNCSVHSAAAAALLDTDPPSGYLDGWTHQVARKMDSTELDTRSILVFRVAAEWLALPTSLLQEIASLRPIHSIPHRRDGLLLGLANIRGELLICISLRHLLGMENVAGHAAEHATGQATGQPTERAPQKDRAAPASARLLVIEREGSRAVCPVDEVYGIHRHHPRDLAPAPATLGKASATYTQAVLTWQDKPVGLLDDQLLFHTVNRSLG